MSDGDRDDDAADRGRPSSPSAYPIPLVRQGDGDEGTPAPPVAHPAPRRGRLDSDRDPDSERGSYSDPDRDSDRGNASERGRSSDPDSEGYRGRSSDPDSEGYRGRSSDPDSEGYRGRSSDPDSIGYRGRSSDPDSEWGSVSDRDSDPDGFAYRGAAVDRGRSSSLSSYPIPLVRDADRDDRSSDGGRSSSLSSYPIPLVRDADRGADRDDARDDGPPLLRVRDLTVTFATDGGVLRALDGVSFDVPRGRTVALVGESGCGKTVTALSLLRLLPEQIATVEAGVIELDGLDLLTLGEREMRAVRGARAAMIFQEPMTSLNPVYTVGAQIVEAIRLHRPVSRDAARHAAIGLLRTVGFPQPETRVDNYPHELSGGMRQRVMIAMALAPGPALLIADEPTTALDMTTQAQILDLLDKLKAETSMSLLLIAHDLAVVAELADEVVVLYAGVVAERGTAREVLRAPSHPYTRALLRSVPARGFRPPRVRGEKARRLPTIAGALPDLRDPPRGCRFQDRCDAVFDRCREDAPALYPVAAAPSQHAARCFLEAPDAPPRTAREAGR